MFEHTGLCAEQNKPLTQTLTIDDGTGKLYNYVLTKQLSWKEYTVTPNFIVSPEEPSILESAQITDTSIDNFNVILNNGIMYDFNEDGIIENVEENSTISKILSVPREQDIIQYVSYFTGWETKVTSKTKTILKTNLPPQVCNEILESGICTPKHIFTSCSVDFEDTNPQSLTINWKIFRNINSVITLDETDSENPVKLVTSDGEPIWEELGSVDNNPVFTWIYSSEGQFKLTETAIDTDGAESSLDRIYDVTFDVCGTSPGNPSGDGFTGSGIIEVESGKWQIIAFPLERMYWDTTTHRFKKSEDQNFVSTIHNCVIAQLEDVYQRPAKELIEVANAMVGDNEETFWNYIPGFTKESSEHNFPLVYKDIDNDSNNTIITKKEIVGFWVKSSADFTFNIKWEMF